jgi:hypothetical protein
LNFGAASLEPEFVLQIPSINKYKDLNADVTVPEITQETVSVYLQGHDKRIDKVSMDMFKDGYFNYIRVATIDNLTFFRAQCRAQMKLHLSYIVDISVDDNAVVQSCQCECAAGMGPQAHCKHICAVLFGLMKFRENGEFVTQQTCTQQLQTFHQAKKHTGSPVKVHELSLAVSKRCDFDPRPAEFVQAGGYKDYFINTCINSGLLHDSAISHIITPANPRAVLLDHSYAGATDPIDSFLKSMRVTQISGQEIEDVETATRDQSSSLLWVEERKKRLNASTFGRICKMTDRTNGSLLARSLLVHKQLNSEAVNHGKAYESVAVAKYEKTTGTTAQRCGLFISQIYPFLSASPDRMINENLLLEVKCPFVARECLITPQTVPYLYFADDGQLALKRTHDYFYQVQGQMFCAGASAVDFLVYTFKDMQIIRINRDEIFLQAMNNALQTFYTSYFQAALLDKFLFNEYFQLISCDCQKFNTEVPGCFYKASTGISKH